MKHSDKFFRTKINNQYNTNFVPRSILYDYKNTIPVLKIDHCSVHSGQWSYTRPIFQNDQSKMNTGQLHLLKPWNQRCSVHNFKTYLTALLAMAPKTVQTGYISIQFPNPQCTRYMPIS